MKINLISKFIYKLFILTCILLLSVVLDKYGIINLNTIKQHLNQNINFINVTKVVNGSLNIIDLGENVINVSLNDSKSTMIEENKYLYELKNNKVYSTILGSVIKINKVNNKYEVTILDENDRLITISELNKVNVKMYQIIKINDLIGDASVINNNNNNNINNNINYCYYYLLTINEN